MSEKQKDRIDECRAILISGACELVDIFAMIKDVLFNLTCECFQIQAREEVDAPRKINVIEGTRTRLRKQPQL